MCLQGGALPPCRRWPEPAGRPPKPPMLVGGPPGTASLPRPHEELAVACQAVSHLEQAPAAAQTFQRGHADANPAHGLGNRAAGSPVVRKCHSVFPSLSTF